MKRRAIKAKKLHPLRDAAKLPASKKKIDLSTKTWDEEIESGDDESITDESQNASGSESEEETVEQKRKRFYLG
jgi:hypothetical protein